MAEAAIGGASVANVDRSPVVWTAVESFDSGMPPELRPRPGLTHATLSGMGDFRALIFVSAALALSACGYARTTYVTMAQEATVDGGSAALTPAQNRLLAARSVFASRCLNCHATFVALSEAEWISSNMIVPGDSTSSFLVGKIRNSGVSGAGDMPADGSNLTTGQIQAIRLWVDNLP